MKLREIATISTGYSFRSRIKHDPEGDTFVIQMGDVDPLYGVRFDQLSKIKFSSKDDRYLIRDEDILMVSKGNNINAFSAMGIRGRTIVVNSLMTIRLDRTSFQPDYVIWYLNSPKVQHYIHQVAAGTGTPNLSKKLLGEIDIPFIDHGDQMKLWKFDQASRKEVKLLKELQQKKEYVARHTLQNAFDKMRKYDKPY